MADAYDPELRDDLVMQAMMRHWENPPSMERFARMDVETEPIHAAWRKAAREAFPWAEVWYGDVEPDAFVAELRARMSDEDAEEIKSRRNTHSWRAIAEWAYNNRKETWRVAWTMPGHQEVGMMVCQAAAERLGDTDWD